MATGLPPRLLLQQLTRNLGNAISNTIILVELADALRGERPGPDAAILDLGAGTKPYEPLYRHYFAQRTSVDVASSPHDISGVDVIASAEHVPFEDGTFDWVLCTEVLEHCPRPEAVLREIHRVLKPGGTCFLTTPFLRPLHEMPHDFYRFTPSALEYLATTAGFTVASIERRGEFAALLILVLQLPLTKLLQAVSRVAGVRLYHPLNPLVLGLVTAPQLLYLLAWQLCRRSGRGRLGAAWLRVFGHYSLGYVTVLRRTPDARSAARS